MHPLDVFHLFYKEVILEGIQVYVMSRATTSSINIYSPDKILL